MTLAHRDDRAWLAQQMLQTNGQAFRENMEMLQEILREQPAWVRNTINRFLQEQEARTFQNVAGQIELFIGMLRDSTQLFNSEDAVALRHLIRDIHPSNMRGLQREAKSIAEEMDELRLCIGNQDWETMYGLMQRIKNKVQRFRDKFTDLRPKLDRLAEKVAELATKCEENANHAEELKQEVEARRDRWLWWLGNFGLFIYGICCGVAGIGRLGGGLVGAGIVGLGIASLAVGDTVAGISGAAAAVATLFEKVIAGTLGFAAVSAANAAACAARSTAASTAASTGAAIASIAASTAARSTAASTAAAAASAAADPHVVLTASTFAPVVASTALLLALFMLGWLGRDRLKSLLGGLWAAEIQSHEYCAEKWRGLEQELKTAAQLLRNSTEGCEKLETCLDAMFEGVEHACEIWEDHKKYPRAGGVEELESKVNELCSTYESFIPAFEHFQDQVMSLQAPSISAVSLLENVQADGSSSVSLLQLEVQVYEGAGNSQGPRGLPQIDPQAAAVPSPPRPASIPSLADEGWILVESEPLGSSTVSFSANPQFLSGRHDCIPGKTYLLVPIEFASRFGALRAAGPSGDRICEVTEEESNQRLMSVLHLGDGEHRLTANHPLRVNRSGVWIQEEAARLHLGDAIVTTMGMEVLSKMPATLLSTEPVYKLDIERTHLGKGEVFICTSVNDNGHKRFSGIAVLSSPKQENSSMRASSAPPLRTSGTSSSDSSGFGPSIGSRLHQEGCCRNVCKKFLRGRCEEAGGCRFCHLPHPEESKRAPRGSRNNRGRHGGAQSSNLS